MRKYIEKILFIFLIISFNACAEGEEDEEDEVDGEDDDVFVIINQWRSDKNKSALKHHGEKILKKRTQNNNSLAVGITLMANRLGCDPYLVKSWRTSGKKLRKKTKKHVKLLTFACEAITREE